MAFDPAVADRLRRVVDQIDLVPGEEFGELKMMGGLCFTLNRRMVVGVVKSRIMVRLSDADYRVAIETAEVVPMDFTGRALRNFAYLNDDTAPNDSILLDRVLKSLSFVRQGVLAKPVASPKSPQRSTRTGTHGCGIG